MRKSIYKLGFSAVAVLVMATFAQASNWTGGTGSFGDGANWDDAGPTVTGGLINISNGGTAQIMAGDAESASQFRMGLGAGTSGTLDMSGGSLTLTSFTNLGENATGTGTVNITGGGTISGGSSVNIAAGGVGSTGTVTISGAGSAWTASSSLWVGRAGNGTLNVLDGGVFSSAAASSEIGRDAGSTGVVLIDGLGSELAMAVNLIVGLNGTGTLTIQNDGLVSLGGGTLLIDNDGDADSFVNMQTGGRLAIFGDNDDDINDFLDNRVAGSDAIRYWNGSVFDDITNGTSGIDYTLAFESTGDLAGYTVLTVATIPEPSSFALVTLALVGLCGFGRRRHNK